MMPLKKTKNEITAEIAESFALYFKDSNDTCHYEWLRNSDEDDNLHEGISNVSESVEVIGESTKNADSSPEIIEKVQPFDCQNGDQVTVSAADENAYQLGSTGKSLGASETTENVEQLQCLIENKNTSASTDATEELPPSAVAIEVGTIGGDSVSLDNCTLVTAQDASHDLSLKQSPVVADTNNVDCTNRNDDTCARIDDIEAASTVSDQLGKYIILIDQQGKKISGNEDTEFENLIRYQQTVSASELTENGLQKEVEVDAPNSGEETSLGSIYNPCTYEYGYDVLQDAQNPMVFHVCPKTPSAGQIVRRRRVSSIFYYGEEVKRCSVLMKDFRIKYRKPNPLENMNFFAEKEKKVKRLRKRRPSYWRKPTQRATPSKKKDKTSNRKIGARIDNENVDQRSSLWNAIQESYPKAMEETVTVPVVSVNPTDIPTFSIEEKNISINEWLELSSQVQPDSNVDMTEFLNYATLPSLPILSDIEEETYQLARFLELHPLSNNESRNTVKPTVPMPQQCNDKVPLNTVVDTIQPLDLSMKQTTPTSTDTGFGGSFSLDVASPYHMSHADTNVRNVYTNVCIDNNRSREISDSRPSESQNVESLIELPTKEKHPCVEGTVSQRAVLPPDWNFDNYSTDLDYEPSEDEDDKSVTTDDEISNKSHQIKITTPPLDTVVETEPRTKSSDKNVVSKARNTPTVTCAISSEEHDSKQIISATVNVVEPEPTTTQTDRPRVASKTPRLLPDNLKQTAAADQIDLIKKQVQFLLDYTCIDYMTDEACSKATCRRNHNLPPAYEVLYKLKQFPTDTILSIYSRFIARNRMAFINYFPTICRVFGMRKLRSSLIAAVEHCDQHNKKSFYENIYGACIQAGMSKVDALTAIAEASFKSPISCTYLLNIVVKEDPEFFKKMLQDFYPLANIESHHMLSLLTRVCNNPEPSLLKLFVDIFDKYSRSNITDILSYKMIYQEIRAIASDDQKLMRRLNSIASRDKRLYSE